MRYRASGSRKWLESPLEPLGNADRGGFRPAGLGRWQFTIEAWVDPRRCSTSSTASSPRARPSSPASSPSRALFGTSVKVGAELDAWRGEAEKRGAKDRHGKTSLDKPLEVDVERLRARFGAWYELFPRSWGGFKGVQKVLPQLAELGFDVIYLPPIHPIGETNRKGRNNALQAEQGDPGSPWAIGGNRAARRGHPGPGR